MIQVVQLAEADVTVSATLCPNNLTKLLFVKAVVRIYNLFFVPQTILIGIFVFEETFSLKLKKLKDKRKMSF